MERKEENSDSTLLTPEDSAVIRGYNLTGKEMTYDACFKNVFSHKQIIAVVAKCLIEEFKDCTVDEIVSLIEDVTIEKEVTSGFSSTLKVESNVPGEATVKFDVVSIINIPTGKEKISIRLRLDIEMQGDDNPGYPLGKRAVYYGSRMISDQLTVITKEVNYSKLEPVHTIWIVLTANHHLKDSVHYYKMERQWSHFTEEERKPRRDSKPIEQVDKEVDLINIYFVYLSEYYKTMDIHLLEDKSILQFLTLMFQGKYDDERMKKNFLMFTDQKLRKDVETMTEYLSEMDQMRLRILERGREEGREEEQERLANLCNTLNSLGRINDFVKAINDKKYLNQLYEEFGLLTKI